jgi:hypothetical protein
MTCLIPPVSMDEVKNEITRKSMNLYRNRCDHLDSDDLML